MNLTKMLRSLILIPVLGLLLLGPLSASAQAYNYSVTIDDGAAVTTVRNVHLDIATDDPAITSIAFSGDLAGGPVEMSPVPSYNTTLTDGAGLKTIIVSFVNEEDMTIHVSPVTITYAPPGPAFTYSLLINGGAVMTNVRNVHLDVDTNDPSVTSMVINGDITGTVEVPYSNGANVILTDGAGPKTVTLTFVNEEGVTVHISTATINYSPLAPGYTYGMMINDGAAVATLINGHIDITTSDPNVTSLVISGDLVFPGGVSSIEVPWTAGYNILFTPAPGVKTVHVAFLNEEGTTLNISSDDILYSPSGTFDYSLLIDGGAAVTNDLVVHLDIGTTNGAVDHLKIYGDIAGGSMTIPYTTGQDVTLSAGEGLKTIYVDYLVGLAVAATRSGTITYDDTSTTYAYSVTLDDGAPTTTDLNAHLDIGTTDPTVTTLVISGDIVGGPFTIPYTITFNVVLTAGEGEKRVNVAYVNEEDVTVHVGFDTILYSTGGGETYNMIIDGGAAVTTDLTVHLDIGTTNTAVDNLRIYGDLASGPITISYTTGTDVTLTAGEGLKTVFVDFLVGATVVATRSDTITYDDTSTSYIYSVVIDDGAPVTTDRNAHLDISTTDPTVVSLIISGDIVGGPFTIPYDGSPYSILLTDGAGEKRVNVAYVNEEDVTVHIGFDTILYNPAGSYDYNMVIDGGAAVTTDLVVHLDIGTTNTAVDHLRIYGDLAGGSITIPYTTGTDVTLTGSEGTKIVYVDYLVGGTVAATRSDDIYYDDTSTTYSYTVTLDDGAPVTNDRNAHLDIGTDDPTVTTLVISGDIVGGPFTIPYTTTYNVVLTEGAGEKRVNVAFINGEDVTVHLGYDTILYDPTYGGYSYNMVIDDGAATTTVVDAHLDIGTTNPGVDQMRVYGDIVGGSITVPYAAIFNVTLTGTEGVKTVSVDYIAGGAVVATRSDTINYDDPATPYYFWVTINGGAAVTHSTSANLDIGTTHPTVTEMIIRGDIVGGPIRVPYATGFNVTLTPASGNKTVWVDYLSGGSIVGTSSDNIRLEADIVIPAEVTFTIQGPAVSSPGFTNTVNVTLLISSPDAAQMLISNDPSFSGATWETFASTRAWVLTSGDGTKTVYLQTKNGVGEVSDTAIATIFLDTVAPISNGAMTVNGLALRSGDYLSATSFDLRQPAIDPTPASQINPATVKVRIGTTEYTATFSGGVISYDFSGTLAAGTYDISVLATDYAGNPATIATVIGVRVRDDFVIDDPIVFPNPVVDEHSKIGFNLSQDASDVKVKIFDLNGFLRRTIEAGPRQAGYNEVNLDIEGLYNDSYIVLIVAQSTSGKSAVGRAKFSVYR